MEVFTLLFSYVLFSGNVSDKVNRSFRNTLLKAKDSIDKIQISEPNATIIVAIEHIVLIFICSFRMIDYFYVNKRRTIPSG